MQGEWKNDQFYIGTAKLANGEVHEGQFANEKLVKGVRKPKNG